MQGRRDSNPQPADLETADLNRGTFPSPLPRQCLGSLPPPRATRALQRLFLFSFYFLLYCQSHSINFAGQEGLEPPTRGFGDRCSTIRATALFFCPKPSYSTIRLQPAFGDRSTTTRATALFFFSQNLSTFRPTQTFLSISCSTYFVSRCEVCLRQRGQNFENSNLSGVVRLFLLVL